MEDTPSVQQELESMRTQMELLRKKLDQETIINEKLMRGTMKSRISTINLQGWISIVAAIFVIVWSLFYYNTFSTAFTITTIIFMLADAIFTFLLHNQVRERQLMSEDMRTVANKMKILKKRYHQSTWIGLPLVIAWCVWCCFETIKITHLPWQIITGIIAFAACIGLIISGIMYSKVINNCNAIIKQIEE